MMARNSILLLALALILCGLYACSPDSDEDTDTENEEVANTFLAEINVIDASGELVSPAGLYVYDAEYGTDRPPTAWFSDEDGSGTIRAELETGIPLILRVHSASHHPLTFFIPSYFEEELKVTVLPQSYQLYDDPKPVIIGNFNR
ncbi:MAG: hypothetical protein LAT80_08895, partial [Balneolaceae bacterium]|nr:hypothetical protein [Balneolaceae bacterium]